MNYAKATAVAAVAALFLFTNSASAQIVALGHSAVSGRVSQSEAWPAQLEKILRARGSNVSVINAGVYGESTRDELARAPGAIPEGTRIVILMINKANDVGRAARLGITDEESRKNIDGIKAYIKSRGIRLIDAMGIYISEMQKPGMLLDGMHLTVEGNKEVAETLAKMLK